MVQGDLKFKASLYYTAIPCLKNKQNILAFHATDLQNNIQCERMQILISTICLGDVTAAWDTLGKEAEAPASINNNASPTSSLPSVLPFCTQGLDLKIRYSVLLKSHWNGVDRPVI